MMIIELGHYNYNARRYSRPWAAVVKLKGDKLDYDFAAGQFLGEHARGNGTGDLIVACNNGDVIAHGQKDGRGGNTHHTIEIVNNDGRREEVTRLEALKYLMSVVSASPAP